MSASVESNKVLKKLVARRHPAYERMAAHWTFLGMCYEGGRDWFVNNIFRYMKEGEQEYADRVNRAYRFNHTREVVDLVNKYLFRAEICRHSDDAPESVKKFWLRTTRQGLSIDEFMRIASLKSSIFGRPWIIVDSDAKPVDENTSKADVEADGSSIYAYVVSPLDVLDMSWDSKGELNWILIREYKRDDSNPLSSSGSVVEQYRLWTRTEWMLVSKKAGTNQLEISAGQPHDLGEVPAVKVDHNVSDDPWVSPALIADIAYLDKATANYASNLDAIIQDQTFSQLAMPAQNVLPGDDAYDTLIRMGTNRVFLYDGEGGVAPQFLSPDPRQAQLILSAIQQIINEIYHSVGLAGEHTKQDNSKGIDNSSGVAKAFDFERVTSLLGAKADSLETAENKIARLVAKWGGEELEKDLVTYSENFDVRGLRDELDIALQLSVIDVPEMVRSEQAKALVEKLFPNLGEKLIEELKGEVDKWRAKLKEKSDMALQIEKAGGDLLGEAKRNREKSGDKQSKTKSRETGE